MSEARQAILDRIRAGLQRGPLTPTECADLQARWPPQDSRPRPRFEHDLVTQFANKLTAVAGTVAHVDGVEQIFAAIAAHLDQHGLPTELVAAPALRDLAWPDDWRVRFGATRGEDLAAVTPCFAAVAETGSVVMFSGENHPTTLNFLPDYHVVLVRSSAIVPYIEDVWPRLRESGTVPRSLNFISGPSKTADVEQTLQLGAHGPRSFHAIVINDNQTGDSNE